LSLLGKRN